MEIIGAWLAKFGRFVLTVVVALAIGWAFGRLHEQRLAAQRHAAADHAAMQKQLAQASSDLIAERKAFDSLAVLAQQTVTARAAETAQLSEIVHAARTASESAYAAPRANDPYVFSPAVYDFLRSRPGQAQPDAAGNAITPAAALGGR